jgi:lysozyme family protein
MTPPADPVQAVDFAKALAFALKWEVGTDPKNPGGYTNDPHDPGGETKWGISKRSYPHLPIASLTLTEARDIYFFDYWDKDGNQESACSELPWPVNFAHFDCTVNVGNRKTAKDDTIVMHRRANMILQRALGVDDDGYIGPVTREALRLADPMRAALKAITQRELYYAQLGSWSMRYQAGWLRRTNALRLTIQRLAPPNHGARVEESSP